MSLQHILKNSSVSGKEPLASQLANGELSINYHADGPFLCCKDTAGNVRRVAGVWVSATAPSTPFPGELWLDTGISPSQLKVYKNTTDNWVFAGEVNSATTTTEGLVRLATDAETQGGISTTSAVTPAGLQSKISDSTSTVSSTTIASSTAVKNLADTVNAALPKSGGTITGTLEIGNTGQLRFEGSSNDAYETTFAVEDPTATNTITLPNRSGTLITTGDTGTVTSTMIADGTIVNADINAAAAIAHSKLAALNSAQVLLGNASNVPTATTVTGDVTISNAGVTSIASGVIVDADINSDAEIAVSKLADGSARQLLQTDAAGTGVEWTSDVDIPGTLDVTGATTLDSTLSVPLGSAAAPSIYPGADTNTGIYSPGADQVAISTGGTQRVTIDSSQLRCTGDIKFGDAITLSRDTSTGLVTIADGTTEPFTQGFAFRTNETDEAYRFQNGDGASTYLTIRGSGNVGIGTASPSSLLQVYGDNPEVNITQNSASPGNAGLRFNAAGTAEAYINFRDSSQIWSSTTGDSLFFGNGNRTSTFLTVDGSGNVGIGTASPGDLVEVKTGADRSLLIRGGRTSAPVDLFACNPASGYSLRDLSLTGNSIQFNSGASTGTSTTERARIDSSGRLLVGTSTARSNFFNTTTFSPALQLEGNNDQNRLLSVVGSNSGGAGGVLVLASQKSGTVGGNTIVSNGGQLGAVSFQGNDGTEFVEAARIQVEVDSIPGADDMPGRLVFSTTVDGSVSPTEAMRINSAQELLVGYTADNGAYKLQVNSQIFATSSTIATSDGRYKDNVTTLDGCADLIRSLRPVSFDWKPQQNITRLDEDGNEILVREGHNFPAGTQVGFIAQEVQDVLTGKPWLGSIIKENVRPAITDADGTELAPEEQFYGIAEGNLIAVLTSALKDALSEIDALKARVAALEAP